MKVQNYPATLLMFCIIASCSSAHAQQRKLQNNPEAPIATYNEPKSVANKVELPDLPEFTGKSNLRKHESFQPTIKLSAPMRMCTRRKMMQLALLIGTARR